MGKSGSDSSQENPIRFDIVIPWSPANDLHRKRAFQWVVRQYQLNYPESNIIIGTCDHSKAFNRSEALLRGAMQSDAPVLVCADADVWTHIGPAVDFANTVGWAVPHLMIHRLAPDSTHQVLMGAAPHPRMLLSDDNERDRAPYRGNVSGTLLVIRRDALFDVPPDIRFVGWGQEDQAWGTALNLLVGKPWRGKNPLYHLWHPPAPRMDRVNGSMDSVALWKRYAQCARDHDTMRSLLNESKDLWNAKGIHP